MWFKLTYSIHSMFVRRSDQLPLEIKTNDENEAIVLWNRELKDHRPHLCCDRITSRALDGSLKAMFSKYGANILPLENPPQVTLPYELSFDAIIDLDGNIPSNWIVPLAIFPRKMAELYTTIFSRSADDISTFIKTMRWIQGTTGTQNPFSFVSFMWSPDREHWQPMPDSGTAIVLNSRAIDAAPDPILDIHKIWKSGLREPLAHELIREAIDISMSNPRSGLLVGFSALETGVKDYIHYLVPNSDVILEKLPSPSVMTMLNDVIPSLHRRTSIASTSFPLSKGDKDFLMKWVTQRNQVAHGIKGDVDARKLRDLLSYIRRTLYLIDFHKGHEWAERHSTNTTP